jgi:hypothetical protein
VPLSPPRDTPVAGRPLVNLSLAVNYAIGGLDVRSYHVTNLALHLLVALAFFGVVRRTLRLSRMPHDLAACADGLALGCALVWALHPLNTEVVNYVVQRTESMMALCYLDDALLRHPRVGASAAWAGAWAPWRPAPPAWRRRSR